MLPRASRPPRVETIALVVQLAVVGGVLGSLLAAAQPSLQNAFVAEGIGAGALVAWRASRAKTHRGRLAWSVLAGVAFGELIFAPLAIQLRDPALFLSGASIGVFLTAPMFVLMLPAFAFRTRAARARAGSVLHRADTLATWAGSCASIALLGLAHQPVVLVGYARVDLSLAFVALSAATTLAVVAIDVRAWTALARIDRSRASGVAMPTGTPRDVGVGSDTEVRIQTSTPFRGAETLTELTVGSVRLARQALALSLLADILSFAFCTAVLGWKMWSSGDETPVHDVAASPDLRFARTDVLSSESPHASASRSGRVAVAPRAYSRLVAVRRIDDGPAPTDIPRFVNVPPKGGGIVLERLGPYDGGYEVRTATGELTVTREMFSVGAHVLARDEGCYAVGRLIPWTDRNQATPPGENMNQGGELLASAVVAGAVRKLVTTPAAQTPDRPLNPDYTRVEASPVAGWGAVYWDFAIDQPSVGAIDGSGNTIWRSRVDGCACCCPAETVTATQWWGSTRRSHLPGRILSVVSPFAVVLYGGGDAGLLASSRSQGAHSSRVDARRPNGSLAWSATIPFLVMQPPVDGQGQIYLAGAGLAALDLEGRTLWSLPQSTPLRAQAFSDGTLVLVKGTQLQNRRPRRHRAPVVRRGGGAHELPRHCGRRLGVGGVRQDTVQAGVATHPWSEAPLSASPR